MKSNAPRKKNSSIGKEEVSSNFLQKRNDTPHIWRDRDQARPEQKKIAKVVKTAVRNSALSDPSPRGNVFRVSRALAELDNSRGKKDDRPPSISRAFTGALQNEVKRLEVVTRPIPDNGVLSDRPKLQRLDEKPCHKRPDRTSGSGGSRRFAGRYCS